MTKLRVSGLHSAVWNGRFAASLDRTPIFFRGLLSIGGPAADFWQQHHRVLLAGDPHAGARLLALLSQRWAAVVRCGA